MAMAVEYKNNSALLVIDMLNDFIEEGGSLVVPGARRIVPFIAQALLEAREKGMTVVFVVDSHLEDDLEFGRWPAHALEGTWGGEIVEELKPQTGEYLVRKRRFSAFFATGLDLLLREKGITDLYLCGVLTNICVYATALDASMRGYRVHVLARGIASLSRETDHFMLGQMEEVLGAEIID
jgi:nicotinamidase-related amidase